MEQNIKSVSGRKKWKGTPCHLHTSSTAPRVPTTHRWVGQPPNVCIISYLDCHKRMEILLPTHGINWIFSSRCRAATHWTKCFPTTWSSSIGSLATRVVPGEEPGAHPSGHFCSTDTQPSSIEIVVCRDSHIAT